MDDFWVALTAALAGLTWRDAAGIAALIGFLVAGCLVLRSVHLDDLD